MIVWHYSKTLRRPNLEYPTFEQFMGFNKQPIFPNSPMSVKINDQTAREKSIINPKNVYCINNQW